MTNVKNTDENVDLWQNSKNHLLGDHSKCKPPAEITECCPGRPRECTDAKENFYEWKEGEKEPSLQPYLSLL